MPMISEEHLQEFMRIYEQEFGESITHADASEMAARLVDLYELLLEPLPSEIAAHQATQPSEALFSGFERRTYEGRSRMQGALIGNPLLANRKRGHE